MTNPRSFSISLLLCLFFLFSLQASAQSTQDNSKVTIYDGANFQGRSLSFGIGEHRLFPADGFNDVASSIKVPAGLVAIVYEHSDEGGGYGRWVDFLEDQPNLTPYNLDNKISHLKIFNSRSGGAVWVRNVVQPDGQFVAGHFQVIGKQGGFPAPNPNAMVGPELPPNIRVPPPPPAVCTISGKVTHDRPNYQTEFRLVRSDGSPMFVVRPSFNGDYVFRNVPQGTYEVRAKGKYPVHMGQHGSEGLGIFSDRDRVVTCDSQGGTLTVNFDVHGIEG
jgi:hypothetical protein